MQTTKSRVLLVLALLFTVPSLVYGLQGSRSTDEEFGPVVRAYLGYLRNEQEVVDDRVSRREVSATYYRHNSNRIRALRQMAIKLARESQNDYLPELEAVTSQEFRLLFERPPSASSFHVGEVLNNTFRFLGTARAGEVFYVFARLDPYEQAELKKKNQAAAKKEVGEPEPVSDPKNLSRSRRVGPP